MSATPCLPLQQHPTFGAALQLLGQDVRVIDLVGAAPLQAVRRFGMTFAPRGPIWTENADKTQGLRDRGPRLLNSDTPNDDALKAAGYRKIMTTAHVAELHLDHPDPIARAKGKWRNIWRQAKNGPLIIKQQIFHASKHAWLLKADLAQQRQKGFRALPHDVIHAFAQIAPQDVIVFTAHLKQEPAAAMLLLRHAPTATYHIGWTNDLGRQHGGHHLILMQAASVLAAQGITRLDLGAVDTQNAPGLARFKIGSGATVRALGGTWLKIPGISALAQ